MSEIRTAELGADWARGMRIAVLRSAVLSTTGLILFGMGLLVAFAFGSTSWWVRVLTGALWVAVFAVLSLLRTNQRIKAVRARGGRASAWLEGDTWALDFGERGHTRINLSDLGKIRRIGDQALISLRGVAAKLVVPYELVPDQSDSSDATVSPASSVSSVEAEADETWHHTEFTPAVRRQRIRSSILKRMVLVVAVAVIYVPILLLADDSMRWWVVLGLAVVSLGVAVVEIRHQRALWWAWPAGKYAIRGDESGLDILSPKGRFHLIGSEISRVKLRDQCVVIKTPGSLTKVPQDLVSPEILAGLLRQAGSR
jgi:hypothetical protein